MSKARLVSFIADIKLTPENEVRILELGPVFWSGFSGYERLTGENPVETHVFPFYKSFGIPVYKATYVNGEFENDTIKPSGVLPGHVIPVSMGSGFDAEKIGSHAAIIMRSGMPLEDKRKTMLSSPYDRFIYTDQNNLANACFAEKALFAAISKDVIPDLLPKQKVYPLKDGKVDAKSILDDFAGHDYVVVKVPDMARGEGVKIINVGDLRAKLERGGSGDVTLLKNKKVREGYNNCVVQEYVPGKHVAAENKRGESGEYDPTIRVLMTAWQEDGQVHVKCHDAYSKLPALAVDEKLRWDNAVSSVNDKIGPQSALVSDEDKAIIYEKLEGQLPLLFGRLFNTDAETLARAMLDDPDDGIKQAGLSLATDSRYMDVAGESGCPEDIADKIIALRDSSPLLSKAITMKQRKGESWETLRKDIAGSKDQVHYRSIWPAIGKMTGGVGLFLALAVAVAGSLVSTPPEEKLLGIFNEESGFNTVDDISNFRYRDLGPLVSDVEKTKRRVQASAEASGYRLCLHGRWDNEYQRVFPAFQMATTLPDEQFVKIDLNSVERSEHNGAVVSEKYVTDTYIFGTACPSSF